MSQTGNRANWGIEQTYDASIGDSTFKKMSASFTESPDIVIIQNDSNVTVTLSQYGISNNISFVAGARLVLDMTDKNSAQTFFTFSKGEQWSVSSSAGTGLFKIAYLYRNA